MMTAEVFAAWLLRSMTKDDYLILGFTQFMQLAAGTQNPENGTSLAPFICFEPMQHFLGPDDIS
jgi:hypothetical protein